MKQRETPKLLRAEVTTDDGATIGDAGRNRLLKAFAVQVEALRRLRNGGSQLVRVGHVHVNEGGQAIVGPVSVEQVSAEKPISL